MGINNGGGGIVGFEEPLFLDELILLIILMKKI